MKTTIGSTDFHPHVFARLPENSGITTERQQHHLAHVPLKAKLTYVMHARRKSKDAVEFWNAEKKEDGLWQAFKMQSC